MKTLYKKKKQRTIEAFSDTCSNCNYKDDCHKQNVNGAQHAFGVPKQK